MNAKQRRIAVVSSLSAIGLGVAAISYPALKDYQQRHHEAQLFAMSDNLTDRAAQDAAINIASRLIGENVASGNVRPAEEVLRDFALGFATQDPPATTETLHVNQIDALRRELGRLTVRLYKNSEETGYCVGVLAETRISNAFFSIACIEPQRPATPASPGATPQPTPTTN